MKEPDKGRTRKADARDRADQKEDRTLLSTHQKVGRMSVKVEIQPDKEENKLDRHGMILIVSCLGL